MPEDPIRAFANPGDAPKQAAAPVAHQTRDSVTKRLDAWGFVHDGADVWVRNGRSGEPKTKFEAVKGGGFYRYEREAGEWRKYPYSIHPDWEGVGGLAFDAKQGATDANAKVKPECFEWVYPNEWMIRNYGHDPEVQKKG